MKIKVLNAEVNTPSVSNSQTELRQKMLCFAYLAYCGEGLTTPNPDSAIKGLINDGLAAITSVDITGWEIVWGPVAYTVPGALYQENLMYILQQSGTSNYAIAIRGTNGTNELDWLLEDFEIQNTIPWPLTGSQNSKQAGAAVTESTSISMNILLNGMIDSDTQQTLVQYLSTVTANAINVCVTGHSLGGALTPTLALWLLENTSAWDASGQSTVSCISFAGPTAGNHAFATYSMQMFVTTMSNGSFPGWDHSLLSNCDTVVCDMDVAPLCYSYGNFFDFTTATAGSIFNLYPNDINFSNLSELGQTEWGYFQQYVIMPLAAALYPQNYTPLQAPEGSSQLPLQSTFNGSDPAGDSLDDYLSAFYTEAIWQHVYSYPTILNVPELQTSNGTVQEDLNDFTLTAISPSSAGNPAYVDPDPLPVTVTFTGSGFDTNATIDIYPTGVNGVDDIIIGTYSVQTSDTITVDLTFPAQFFNMNDDTEYFSYYIFRVLNSDGNFSNTSTFYYYWT